MSAETNLQNVINHIDLALSEASKLDSSSNIQRHLVNALMDLGQLRNSLPKTVEAHQNTNIEAEEVRKVSRKIRNKWSKNPNQKNTLILSAFLRLKNQGVEKITFEMIEQEIGLGTGFYPSFQQMKTISEKNNGKVFETFGEFIEIWPPVKNIIDSFNKEYVMGVQHE